MTSADRAEIYEDNNSLIGKCVAGIANLSTLYSMCLSYALLTPLTLYLFTPGIIYSLSVG